MVWVRLHQMSSDLPSSLPRSRATLEGVLERVTFTNEENGWSVVRLTVPGKKKLVTAVGNLLGAQPGENLRLTGRWVTDRQYGEQFRADSFLTVKPATLVGIEKYLGSGLIRGVGEVMAARMVKHFGLQTLEVIDAHPERLTEVDGIGPIRSERIQSAWAEHREIQQVMVFLQSHGVSTSFAVKIYKQYKHLAIAVVRENPYRLAIDIHGIGFKTADKIAAQLGISPTSPRRAEAGVLHLLGELSEEGHVFYPHDRLVTSAVEALQIDAAIVDQAIRSLTQSGDLIVEPLSEGGQAAFLKSLHIAETGSALFLRGLLDSPLRPIQIDVERAIAWFEQKQKMTLAEDQRQAIRDAISRKVLVITGGPGTGKTTLIRGVIQILEKKGRRILLAAPTGRAAKRLSEATGQEAKTIHRLLEFSPKSGTFERNPQSPLAADLVILDEASMIDTVLAYHVLKALPPHCQLILVGDVDQLPSVGPGSVLRDIIHSGAVRVIRLSHIFRQAQRSLIVTNAHRVNAGQFPELQGDGRDFLFIERGEPEEVLRTLRELVKDRLPKQFGLDPVEDIQVLSPMHRGTLGAANLNAELQALLNPSAQSFTRGSRLFRIGDKVMQIRNNYELDVYNGDIGRVADIDSVEQQIQVSFDARRVVYDFADVDELVLAYACSIHKSQGSEYPCVIIPIHTQHYVMLQRNLLYTGMTRGRRLVVLVGSKRALAIAVKNAQTTWRFTRLAHRLKPNESTLQNHK